MKLNKKIAALIIGMMVCCTSAFAQENQENLGNQKNNAVEQAEAKPFKVYCEIISYASSFFSNKLTIEIDFGQRSSFFLNDREVVDDNGTPIKFNSMVDALNYMGERSWELVDEYYDFSQNETSDRKHHWVLCKTVTDKSQISEGIRTIKMK